MSEPWELTLSEGLRRLCGGTLNAEDWLVSIIARIDQCEVSRQVRGFRAKAIADPASQRRLSPKDRAIGKCPDRLAMVVDARMHGTNQRDIVSDARRAWQQF